MYSCFRNLLKIMLNIIYFILKIQGYLLIFLKNIIILINYLLIITLSFLAHLSTHKINAYFRNPVQSRFHNILLIRGYFYILAEIVSFVEKQVLSVDFKALAADVLADYVLSQGD